MKHLLSYLLAAGLTPTSTMAAQTRIIDLAGDPLAAAALPASAMSNGIELSGGGFLYLDARDKSLVLADLDSSTQRVLGAEGAGPGEYIRPTRVISDGRGGALVFDLALRRGLHVSPSGELSDRALTSFDRARFNPATVRGVDPLGRFIHHTADPAGGRDSLPIVRTDTASRDSKVMAWWPMARSLPGAVSRGPGGMTAQEIRPQSLWPARTAWVVLPDGTIALVCPEPYRIEFVKPDGSRISGPVVDYEPVEVTADHRRAVQRERGGPIPRDQFPDELPPFEGLDDVLASPNGEIWVGRMRAWNDSVPVYDVFDAIGRRTAQARLRSHSKVVGFGNGTVYVARQTPDDGLWWLERYRRLP